MNNILLSELNQVNIGNFFKILSKDADIPNVSLANIDVAALSGTMHLCPTASFFLTECDTDHQHAVRPIGVLLCSVNGTHADILLIYIAPKYRRAHLGQDILTHGLNILRSHNVSTVSLDVLSDNEPAIRLYTRNGFTQTGTVVTLRNETSSFYQEPKHICLKKTPSLLIMPTLRMFSSGTTLHKDICNNISYLSSLTDCNQAEFVTVQRDNKTVGYCIFSRRQNTLRIHQYGMKNDDEQLLFETLSALIQTCTIVLLQIQGCETDQIERFIQHGFYIDFTQQQFIKKI
ncbi:MAG: GNAT family N-acetyltransferase [Spirochaetales bacterium]|nr:GNAT family N-acetyltransferase [Spirochaetales bacterium]